MARLEKRRQHPKRATKTITTNNLAGQKLFGDFIKDKKITNLIAKKSFLLLLTTEKQLLKGHRPTRHIDKTWHEALTGAVVKVSKFSRVDDRRN